MSDDPQAAFAAALAKFQAELPHVGKEQHANAGQYGYDYAGLEDIAPKVLPLLAKNGLAWTAAPDVTDQGFVLRSALLHTDGHREPATYPLPDPSKANAQAIGSAITYGRRYCFTALTGVTPGGEDDDGKKAEGAHAAPQQSRQPKRTDPRAEAWKTVADYAKRLSLSREAVADEYALWAQGELLDNATASQLSDFGEQLKKQLTEVPF